MILESPDSPRVNRFGMWQGTMTYTIGRYLRVAVMAFGTVALTLLMPWSFLVGNMVARVDLARGHARLMQVGLPVPWSDDAATVLRHDYGIKVVPLGCRMNSTGSGFARGYNAAVHDALKSRSGHDVINGAFHHAEIAWNRDHTPRQ